MYVMCEHEKATKISEQCTEEALKNGRSDRINPIELG